jgi:hypothetical protein
MKKVAQESLARGFVLQGFDRSTDELKVSLLPIDRLRSATPIRSTLRRRVC